MIDAILWDYDGTLADSYEKNYLVTLEVLRQTVPRLYEKLPAALASKDTFFEAVTQFENWRELYVHCYGMTAEETEIAGAAWERCQRESAATAPLYGGIGELLQQYRQRKQGIISQNSSDEIIKALRQNGLGDCVQYVCGYTDVPQFSPKPSPVPFRQCVEKMALHPESDTVVYIGDHEEDVLFVRNIRRYYRERGNPVNVYSVAVSYSGSHPENWQNAPDYLAGSTQALKAVLQEIDESR